MAAGGLSAEVVVEGDDAVHLCPRHVQRQGDLWHGRLRNASELLLQRVQDRHCGTFQMEVRVDDLLRADGIPGGDLSHFFPF